MTKKTANINICSACGTSPVNHHLLFIYNFIEETFGKTSDKIFSFIAKKGWQKITSTVEKTLYVLFSTLGIVHFESNMEKALTGRSRLIWEEAKRRSIVMEQVILFGKHIELYRAKINGKIFYFQSLPVPPHLHQNGYKWLDDKFKLFEKLKEKGLPVPGTRKIVNFRHALEAFETLQKPVILKPKNGSRGRHTTTNISTKEDLKKAFLLAREITLWMIMQEHLFGNVYRATVINNKLVGFFRADAPQIIGHDLKTIKELIEEKNNTRHKRLSEIKINDDVIDFIKRQNYSLENILPDGKVVNLSAKTGRMYSGYTKEMLPDVHPKIYSIFKKAGEIVEAPVIGFDLIIEDPTKDPDTQHWGIIECNSLPFIDLHYFALEGEPINLAKNVWDLWDETR